MGWLGADIPLAGRSGVTISLVWCTLHLQSFVTRVSLCLAWSPASIVCSRSLQLGICFCLDAHKASMRGLNTYLLV